MRVHGSLTHGFEAVKERFIRNFSEFGETGAACAVYQNGRLVVDFQGGIRDTATGDPWATETMVPVFSTSKGISALVLALMHSRGLLDYDAQVSHYWPEFAQNGKETVTVRQLINHQAGLCALSTSIRPETIADKDALAAILAAERPAWEPGTTHGYHCWDLGWYQSELIRRIDPQGRTLSQYLDDEIVKPLNVQFHIGLPPDVPQERIAHLETYRSRLELAGKLFRMPWRFTLQFFNPRSLTSRAMLNPPVLSDHRNFNRRDVLALEIPSGNGVGTARALAAIYNAFLSTGGPLGIQQETVRELTSEPVLPTQGAFDQVLRAPMCYSLGFIRPWEKLRFGSSSRAFGFHGAGGSFAFADPDAGISYAYVTNRMEFNPFDTFDTRDQALRNTIYDCLGIQQLSSARS